MRRLLFILIVCCFSCKSEGSDHVLVTVKRKYPIPKSSEEVKIAIPWKALTKQMPAALMGVKITDQNFGRSVTFKMVDSNGDRAIDFLMINYKFESTEPIFTFLIEPDQAPSARIAEKIETDPRLEISFLSPFPDYEKEKGPVKDIASKIVESTINTYPNIADFPIYAPNRWNYEYSFFLAGGYKLGKNKNNQAFIDYPQKWVDSFITDNNFKEGVYDMSEYKLDDVIPARLAILFHQQTGNSKYKAIADTIALQLKRQPKTSDGGYWHKQIYPNQMWLDGVFMGDVFSMQYAQAYNQPEWYDEAIKQIKLIYQHTRDEKTGLLYHGWDESKNPVWAHPQKGTSPEFWGRAVGWYAMALIECLDYLPENHPERKNVIKIFQDVAASVKKYQDKKTSLWFQVLDKGDKPGNWIETSCSAMFAYTFAKGNHKGYLDKSFLTSAQQAYDGLLKNYVYVDGKGNLHLDRTVKVGTLNPKTSKGDFQYYITTECRIDDYKGLAALLYASIELER
ncbi:MAG TPA: glycoside hydrolase family 88 protein [Cyclobacteriaceae bacterium]|nr:glycoside hydrolase family 88 protein [Cyclobacteriaceae bacterium]